MNAQFLKFAGVGILNFLIDLLVLNFLLWAVSSDVTWFMVAKAISFLMAMMNSFFWNKHWTFQSRGSHLREVTPFMIISGIALLINVGIASLFFRLFITHFSVSLAATISAILGSISASLCNFFGYKYFVFGNS